MQSFNPYKFPVFYLILLLATLCWGQDSTPMGVLSLPGGNKWSIRINDSLIISPDNCIIHLPQGRYHILIAPLNQKRWPLLASYHEIDIQNTDTLYLNPNTSEFSKELLLDQSQSTQSGIKELPVMTLSRPSTRVKKYLQPGSLVLAVVSNWASFYLKRRADDYYDNYRRTTNLSKINYYYNQASHYDQYALVMLGVSASALATYFYFQLRD